MIDVQTEKKFLLDVQRNAWRESVKWAFFGYVLNRGETSIEILANQFIDTMGLHGRFSPDSLRSRYYEMKKDFTILEKCGE